MEKKRILWFSDINKQLEDSVGEKAYYLAETHNKKLQSNKASVPNGFVITKESIDEFFEEKGIKNAILNITEGLDKNNEEELHRAESQIKELILKSNFNETLLEEIAESYETLGVNKLEIEKGSAYDILANSAEPIFVALRASNKTGIGDSYFNIKGNTAIISTIKKILSSLFTKENLKETKEESTAIIVQKMIQSDKSGIVYSDDKVLVKSIWGLGGGLTQEEITPDEFTIRRDGKILNKIISEKKYAITRDSSGSLRAVTLKEGYSHAETLDEAELQEISDINLRLESIFNKKTNFHFSIEDDNIYIVTVNEPKQKAPKIKKDQTKQEEQPEEIEEITDVIKKAEDDQKEKEQTQKETLKIQPIENATKTKIELLIDSKEDNEIAKETLLKNAILNVEDIIKERRVHPLGYIENFNTKGYEEVLTSGLHENSNGLKEVWVKLSDFTTSEFENLEDANTTKENNPLMGLCGIRFLLTNPELLKRELKAIHSLSGKKEVGVLIPKVSSVYEIKKVKEYIKNLDINIKVGVILETPASIQLIKDFIEEGIDAAFFANDTLTQYLLAIDKENESTKEFYDDTNPALMYQLEYVIRVCKRKNVKTGFYGNALEKKEMVEFLIKKHIDSLVAKPQMVNKIYEEIIQAEEKHIDGTDKEPRQYEKNKEIQRQQKEIEEFEKIKNEQIQQEVSNYNVNEKDVKEFDEKNIEEIQEPNETIQKEKEQPKQEITNENFNDIELKQKIEKFDDEPEEIQDIEDIEEFETIPEELQEEIENMEKEKIKQRNEESQPKDNFEEEFVTEETIETPDFEEEFLEDEEPTQEDENNKNKDVLGIF